MTTRLHEKPRVLLIEDDRSAVETVSSILVNAGYEVSTAETGASGIAAAKGCAPDLVLLDLGLPDIPGTAVARSLRALYGWRAPIVAFTGLPDPGLVESSIESGCDAYLSKPTTLNALLGLLHDVLTPDPPKHRKQWSDSFRGARYERTARIRHRYDDSDSAL